jgi:hypothetical protein
VSSNNSAIGIFNGSTLVSNGAAPFVTLDNATLTVGPVGGGGWDLLGVGYAGGPLGNTFSTATFKGPLLQMLNGSSATVYGHAVMGSQNATITGTGSGAFIQIDGGGLVASNPLVGLFNSSHMSLGGGILEVSSPGTLTVSQGILDVVSGSQLTLTGMTDPAVAITGGTHSLGTTGTQVFTLFGATTASDPVSGLPLGTDRPLRGATLADGTQPVATPLLQLTGATANAGTVVLVDTALLEATAPLLSLTSSGSTKSVLNTAGTNAALDLNIQASVSMLGSSVVRLDNSILNVANGPLVSAIAAKLTAAGDLVSLLNGATLTLLNGPLITVSNGGFVNIAGSLINFGGTGGNNVSITNSLCPCVSIGGIPVALQGGAAVANVQITNPIKNNGTLGTVTLSPNAAVAVVNGATSKLSVAGH